MPKMKEPPEVRFWRSVEKTKTCWLWKKSKSKDGYPHFCANKKVNIAHRWIWELLNGKILDGYELDHLCKVRHCVNPNHLEMVTHRENILRSDNFCGTESRQTHCKRGHPFDKRNTYFMKDGGRCCRQCVRDKRGVKGPHPRDKTHCKNGHEFNDQNTRIDKKGGRNCIPCHREWMRQYRLKNRP